MAQKIDSHDVSTYSEDNVRRLINKNGFLYRTVSGMDYGIDAIVELFDEGYVTGKIALLQLKGKKEEIEFNVRTKDISCEIKTSTAKYAFQRNIPVIVIYASLADENSFYYVCLQDIDIPRDKVENQKDITIRIPSQNKALENIDGFRKIINDYYNR